MDGLYRPGEGYQKASGGQVSGQENRPPSPDGGTDRPYSGTPREGCIPPSFCPRARVSPPPIRLRPYVLLWDRFHDLSPNSFLNISTFIVVCEAFLRISPHFGLWLKIFNVKPKVVGGEHAECGGAMVSKMPNVIWPTGTFNDSVKEWQQQWFYITEPRSTEWAATPEFRSGAPLRLTS